MYEKIVEIIVYVISELKVKNDINNLNLDTLINQGYTNTEISTALSWIVDRLDVSEQIYPFEDHAHTTSFRILHDFEKELFTTEAWGELITLSALGLIGNEHIEALIDKSMMLGLKKIDIHHLKIFVANFVFNAEFNNFGGSKFMLDGSDTIN